MTPARLVAIDLDGTLLRSDHTVSERSRQAIAAVRAAGVEVLLATARSPRNLAGLAAEVGVGGLAICANGATLYDLDEARIVRHTPLPPETVHELVRGLRERYPDVAFGWEHELRFGSEPAYEALRQAHWWPRPDGSYEPCDALDWTLPMTKLLARLPGADLDEMLEVARELAGDSAGATLAGSAFVELHAPGVGKEAALAEIATQRGIEREAAWAFGDHVTDAAMVAWAGHGIAVANAHPSVLAVADEVCPSNDDDGVAVVLERLAVALRG